MARLTLQLLGGFSVRLGAGPALSLGTRKAQALTAYLAVPPGRAHPRDKLASLLWGDTGDEQARQSLRQTLVTLRRALPATKPPILVVDLDTLTLNAAAVEVDVQAFERFAAGDTVKALEQAVALYRGDLLEGVRVTEEPFEDWLRVERARLRERAVDALTRLLTLQSNGDETEGAVHTAARLLALDPVQEAVHRTLMRLYARQGRRGEALRQYQVCVSVLQRELRADPEVQTRHLYRELLQQTRGVTPDAASLKQRPLTRGAVAPAPDAPNPEGRLIGLEAEPAGMRQSWAAAARGQGKAVVITGEAEIGDMARETPLVGREVELAQLRDALQAALAGQGQLAAVMGEPGIGKSRLVAELVAEARRKGARILLGRCYETEQVLPFGPWINVLRASRLAADGEMLDRLGPVWSAELARLLPEIAPGISPSTPTSGPAQLFEAVAQLLERVTLAQPTVLVFEDLHWADEMSLRLLAFAGRRLQRCRLLAVATVRDENLLEATLLRHTLDELGQGRHLSRLSLGSLSREDTVALAHTLVQFPAVSRLEERIWTASLGHPFIVVETLRGRLPEDTSPLPLPERVRDLIAHRLERLGDRSRRLLAVAAVIGRPFDFALLHRAADLGEGEVAEGVEELVRHRVLHGSGEGLELTHDRIREVVYGQLVPARRALLHRRVAEALEALYAGALETHALALGTHYWEGEAWAKAVVYLAQAGVLASLRYAKRDAVAWYEQALAALARLPESRQTREQAAEVRFNLAHSLFSVGQFERAKESFLVAEALALAVDNHRLLGQIQGGMTYLLGSEGHFEDARRSGLHALTIAASLGDLGLQVWSSVGLGRVYFAQGNYRAAIERMRWVTGALKGVPIDERFGRGSIMPSVTCRAWLALCLGHIGEYSEAIAWGGEGVRIAETAAGPLERVWALYCLGRVHLERGDADVAIPLLEQAVPLCGEGRFPIYSPRVLACLGAASIMRGRLDSALPLLEQAAAEGQAIKLVYGHPEALIHTGEAHMAAGGLDEARRYAGQALDLASRQGARGDQARALHFLGEIASREELSESEQALEHYAAALVLAEELGMAPLQARCYLGRGGVHQRVGQDEKAQGELTHAVAMLEAMRMRYWLPRSDALMRSAGRAGNIRMAEGGDVGRSV